MVGTLMDFGKRNVFIDVYWWDNYKNEESRTLQCFSSEALSY